MKAVRHLPYVEVVMSETHNVLTLESETTVAEAAAEIFIATSLAAVEMRGRFVCALAGGSTPRKLYAMLARPEFASRVPWEHCFLFFGDERCVPRDHPDSNHRMAVEALFHKVPVVGTQVYRIQGELSNPARAAHFYEESLRELFPEDRFPRFDMILLGIGEDGHTASLFPETDALREKERWVVANYVPALSDWRITLTLPAINAARQILFLATGARKARIVSEAFGDAEHEGILPAEQVLPQDGAREVLLDRAAAALLG